MPMPAPQSYEEVTYEVRINQNPVNAISENATTITYESLSNHQKEIVLNTMGDKNEGLFNSYVAEYVYTVSNPEKPAKPIATADYLSKENQTYQVFSRTYTKQSQIKDSSPSSRS